MATSHVWLVEEAMESPYDDEIEFGVIAICNDLSTARPLAEQSAQAEFPTRDWRGNSLWVRVEGEWFEHIRCRLIATDEFLPELKGVLG